MRGLGTIGVPTGEPAWHHRARQQRAAARVLLRVHKGEGWKYVHRAQGLLDAHHGSSSGMVQWKCSICGLGGNYASRATCRAEGCNGKRPQYLAGKEVKESKWEQLQTENKKLKSQLEAATKPAAAGLQPVPTQETNKGEELNKARQQLAELKKMGPSFEPIAKQLGEEIEKQAKEARDSKPGHWHRRRLWEQANKLQKKITEQQASVAELKAKLEAEQAALAKFEKRS